VTFRPGIDQKRDYKYCLKLFHMLTITNMTMVMNHRDYIWHIQPSRK